MKRKAPYYFILLSLSILFSCKKNAVKTETIQDILEVNDTLTNTQKRLSLLKLNSKIKQKINDLESYTNTKIYIDSLNITPYSKAKELAFKLDEQLEELTNQLDSNLKTKSVLSRLKQIETYSKGIGFETSKNNIDTLKIKDHIYKTLAAYNNFITQLNETNIKLPDNLRKQLKSRSIKKDSIKEEPLF